MSATALPGPGPGQEPAGRPGVGAAEPGVLVVRDLRVRYPSGVFAVRGVELDLPAGGSLALVGESGCGKTTVARAVLGLLPRRARVTGSVEVAGRQVVGASVRTLRELRGLRVGLVGQNPFGAFDPLRTVGHHVREAWAVHGLPVPPGRVTRLLAALGIPEPQLRAGRHPHEWSGGMLQRASIAAAQALGPALLVADEPTSALDADLADATVGSIRSGAAALLLITHDLALAARHADRVAVLYAGRVVETGLAADVLTRPRHPYTRALLASIPRAGAGLPQALPGSPPDLRREPDGCAFADRCPVALATCSDVDPPLRDGVACAVPVPSERAPA